MASRPLRSYTATELYTTQLLVQCYTLHNHTTPLCFQDDGAWPLLLDDYVEWRREPSAEVAESRE
jgi:hypothetical protein